jgi:hypothetical protein
LHYFLFTSAQLIFLTIQNARIHYATVYHGAFQEEVKLLYPQAFKKARAI